eukprot:CAMPEP_0198310596 /NCGR_PEP_ID=MMETSP1450-20131203/2618_1 /TAXON_ID=753684 ORGANISM="Madagascaria erythrocladiodes, Strain CCMP3234" /NCGR_SAMPLE_ID=MMETSP1450 /ASSEMBLY_ACC=CAM_ASM_001115 /LENGTH=982 /DNA_ID=CAMNT_0044013439 /DNA_START=634 /DNA_END=3582 /DNA_ORIENTATION=+
MGQSGSHPAGEGKVDCEMASLFRFLDSEHRGFLTLKELIHAAPHTALPHSIPALFFFDHEKNGTLSPSELAEIVGTCREEKRCALQDLNSNPAFRDLIEKASAAGVRDCSKHDISSFRRLSNNCNIRRHYCRAESSPRERGNKPCDTSEASSVASTCDAASVEDHSLVARRLSEKLGGGDSGFDSDDEAEDEEEEVTPRSKPVKVLVPDTLPTPISASPQHKQDVAAKTVAMYCSQREFEALKEAGGIHTTVAPDGKKVALLESGSTTAVDAAVVDKVNKEFLRKMAAQLLNNDGAREQFMQWLWKLTDISRTGLVDTEDIGLLLQVLDEDGIDVTELVFNQDRTLPMKQRIMTEFETTHSGKLTRDDFMVFADLVTREYEYWETRHLDCIGDYELGRTLGRGSSGIVRSAVHVDTKMKFAAKIIKKGNCSDLSKLDREIQSIQIMSDHPGVVDLHEVLETDDNLVLILELCGGGSLVDITRLYLEEKMPEDVTRHFMSQMFDALASCHENGVCHRDVRLDNMLIDNDGSVKITDFGHAGIFSPEWDLFQTSLVGSIYNLSPEQIAGQCYSGEKIDVWSAGIALYSLLVGRPPFFDADTVQLLQSITTGTFELPGFLSEEAQDLIKTMIRVRREERPSLRKCLQHPWFSTGPKTVPVMNVVNIPVDRFFKRRPDLAEMLVAGTVHEYRLHFHLSDEQGDYDSSAVDWQLKCLDPNMGIKFSISLISKPPADDTTVDSQSLHEPSRIGRLEDSGRPSLVVPSPSKSILVRQSEDFVDESGYDEDDEEDAEEGDHTTKGRNVEEPFTQIRQQIAEYPSKRIPPSLTFSVSPRGSSIAVPEKAEIDKIPSMSLGPASVPSVARRKSSHSDVRSMADQFQPFVEVRLCEGDSGLFLKVCRNLKKICDTKLANAAAVYRSKFEGRRTGSLRRNVSDLFLRHDEPSTGSDASASMDGGFRKGSHDSPLSVAPLVAHRPPVCPSSASRS